MLRKPKFDRLTLIELARDLFWQRGWAGTSKKDLAHTLQLKPESFYAAFGSKDILLRTEDAFTSASANAEGAKKSRKLTTHEPWVGVINRIFWAYGCSPNI